MIPTHITADMTSRFRQSLRADADVTEAEIHSGLAAVFTRYVWQDSVFTDQFTTELVSDPQEPHVLTTWYRALELAAFRIGERQGDPREDVLIAEATMLLPILLSPPQVPQ